MRRGFVALLHAGYWATYLLLLAVVFAALRIQSPHKPGIFTILLASRIGLLAIVPNVVAFYLSYLVLFPRFLARKRIGALLAGVVAGSLLAAGAGLLALYLWIDTREPVLTQAGELIGFLGLLGVIALIHEVIALVMRGFVDWFGDLRVKEELRGKTLEMEMALIRSKLDPHFLFNTLNNIDVLIERDPPAASLYLNKLCDLMRFVLYEAREPSVPLATELGYIETYIDLQRIRSANPGYVSYDVSGRVAGLSMAPMIFIPFIENAFKHAASPRSGDAIAIRFQVDGSRVAFHCSNRYRPGGDGTSADHYDMGKGGLGNELIRRRLALLYPERHTLEVADHDERYTVRLQVDLE
jgi:hypothetical protein